MGQCTLIKPIPVAALFKERVWAVRLLGVRVRIPSGSWMSVCCECCVMWGWVPWEETYLVFCVTVIVKPRKWGGPAHQVFARHEYVYINQPCAQAATRTTGICFPKEAMAFPSVRMSLSLVFLVFQRQVRLPWGYYTEHVRMSPPGAPENTGSIPDLALNILGIEILQAQVKLSSTCQEGARGE